MKAKLTGMGSYQGNPTADSSITITYSERLEDGAGNASVSQYVGKLDTGSRSWRDAHTGGDLLLPVTLSNTVRVEVTEVFRYTTRGEVRTTFTGWATPTNMDGTELDYTQMRPPRAPSGAEPLTMQAARDLLARGNAQLQQTAQATAELRSVVGVRSLGRAPQAGDPAGLYRWIDGAGHEVDSAWDGNVETGRTAVLVTQADIISLPDPGLPLLNQTGGDIYFGARNGRREGEIIRSHTHVTQTISFEYYTPVQGYTSDSFTMFTIVPPGGWVVACLHGATSNTFAGDGIPRSASMIGHDQVVVATKYGNQRVQVSFTMRPA
ncbi:hypothetical protein ACFSR9_08970 [Deinococcus taklimakanensis]|uniref:Uncharacterized protein n=1 Tax=Deinococcus taklimakanensis TaxID=536443 RepID=A0ABW5P598_9DEIO